MSRLNKDIIVAFIAALAVIIAAFINRPQSPVSSHPKSPPESTIKSVIQRASLLGYRAYWESDASLLEDLFVGDAMNLLRDSISKNKNEGRKIKNNYRDISYRNISFENDMKSA